MFLWRNWQTHLSKKQVFVGSNPTENNRLTKIKSRGIIEYREKEVFTALVGIKLLIAERMVCFRVVTFLYRLYI